MIEEALKVYQEQQMPLNLAAVMRDYLAQTLATGGLAQVEALFARDPSHLPALLDLLPDLEQPMQVRVGIGAVLEGLAGNAALHAAVPRLAALTRHADHRVRGDACHYLGLSGRAEARPALEACLADAHPEVRESAQDALDALAGSASP